MAGFGRCFTRTLGYQGVTYSVASGLGDPPPGSPTIHSKDQRFRADRLLEASNRLRPAVPTAMIGGGTWEGAHARHEAARVRQPARRRGGVAAGGACAAAGGFR